ncbi:hypothetical protein ACFL27_06930 [candidate division CSSED10-310 bacterium]|uniref:Uncharacterized protein n=1 Tax=candidate division CSSED10-310 bacterium TaxID=2855610 RepID=A0ABV6YUP4_UNCC1
MKQLSSIIIKEKKITIQTELAQLPNPHIRTLAYIGGKILIKREQDIEPDLSQEKLQTLISVQHVTVENEIKLKLYSLRTKKKE